MFEGLGTIPWTAIVQWFDRCTQFRDEDLPGFVSIIRRLDEAYKKWADDNKPKNKTGTMKTSPQPPARPKKRRMKRVHGQLSNNGSG